MSAPTPAPNFDAVAHDGTAVNSEQLLGKVWVLFFYPRDNTPGCTVENIDFSALYPQFQEHGVAVFGVSRDSNRKHHNFAAKHQLTVPLIADTEERICLLFDVMREKNMYGKRVRGVERSTFLVNAQGQIARAWRKVEIEGHAAEVLAEALALAADSGD